MVNADGIRVVAPQQLIIPYKTGCVASQCSGSILVSGSLLMMSNGLIWKTIALT